MQKKLHGKHPKELKTDYIDEIASNRWLVSGELFAETEGLAITIQDQVVSTRNNRKHIIKQNIHDSCRRCFCPSETVFHILSSCSVLASTDYLERHNAVANIIRFNLGIKHDLIPKRKKNLQMNLRLFVEMTNITFILIKQFYATDICCLATRLKKCGK
ncbi:hypothetical protein HHI36_001281 [Cryptolaemus montrouzieri]|uniref:Reverse transcriptase zinc-binding domain-containing protein n=1 Tax=Cryptolaemus montrouzieri TaxID=559131 RepID=A0ABD2P7R4_9CUCU